MTPILKSLFGDIRAVQSNVRETSATYTRVSALYQREGSVLLLNAELEISKHALPAEIVEALRGMDVPFGQLLIDRGIEAISMDRTIFNEGNPDGPDVRWGRRHKIVDSESGCALCRVQELLVPEYQLISAHDRFMASVQAR